VRERDRLARFLDAHGECRHPYLTVWAAQEASRLARVVAVSLMHGSACARLVDPWPAPEVTFVGYDFETDIYQRRLRYRNRMRNRLGLDDMPRSRTTGVPLGEFGSRTVNSTTEPSDADANDSVLPDSLLAGFDRVIGGRRGVHRRPAPIRKPGEEVVQARYMKFCGTSWGASGNEVFVAEDGGRIVGTYYLRANNRGGGSHVANCGYIVAANASRRGVARAMCVHSLERARGRGFTAMQFNFVISSNERAVRLWQDCGFAIVGTLPGAFAHPIRGLVDAYVMYRSL
jgi:RimJ/RimL family protein N-acetyltransferase